MEHGWVGQLFRYVCFGLVIALCALIQPTWAAPIDWNGFWSRVEESSPRLQALKVKVGQVDSQVALDVAPPMVAFGSMGMSSPVSDTMERTFEITQKLPFPTKFGLANGVKMDRVKQSELEREVALIQAKVEIYRNFVELHELVRRRHLLVDKQKFFEEHLKRLRAYTISDQIQQLHILEIEATLMTLDSDLKQSIADEQLLRLKLGAWIFQDGKPFTDHPTLGELKFEPPRLKIDPKNSPDLRLAHASEELREHEKLMAEGAWLPDWSITYRRHFRLDQVMPSSHEVVLGIELPFIFPGQTRAKVTQAELVQKESALIRVEKAIAFQTETASLNAKLVASGTQLKLLKEAIIPNLEKRMRLLHRLAQTDMESLELHRSTYEQLEAAQEKNLRLEVEYRAIRFQLEILSGGG